MNDALKETLCTTCRHCNVCKYRDDYLAIVDAMSRVSVNKTLPNGKITSQLVSTFNFIGDIKVACNYYTTTILQRGCDNATV